MFFIFIFGLLWAGNHSETGFIFMYPFYLNTPYMILMCLGTWAELYFVVWQVSDNCDEKFNDKVFSLVAGSSMWVYISHDFFQAIIITPLYYTAVKSEKLDFWTTFFIVLAISHSLTLLSYMGLPKAMRI